MRQILGRIIFVCLHKTRVTFKEILYDHRVGEVHSLATDLGGFRMVDGPLGFVGFLKMGLNHQHRHIHLAA